MNRILPILRRVGQVAQGVALTSIFLMNSLMGYIMFAPDDLPKPFYLSYAGDPLTAPVATSASASSHAGEAVAHAAEDGPQVVLVYEPGQGVMVETGTKIVNLADPGGRRYLKASITIEVAPPVSAASSAETASSGGHGSSETAEDPAMTAFNEEMAKRMPIINDIITTLLSGKTFESIYTVEGKESLRQEILTQLNERLPDLQVIAVYFTEFVVQ